MGQNNIWMRYLLFGAFSLFIALGFSCKQEYTQKGIFVFVNQTNFNISAGYEPEKLTLMPNSTVIREKVQVSRKEVNASTFRYPLSIDNMHVVKIGDRCIINTKDSEHSILDIKTYVAEKIGERTYRFTYTFTEADYSRAVACP